MPIKKFLIILNFFFLAVFMPIGLAIADESIIISVPQSLDNNIKNLIKLKPGQRIELSKSLFWRAKEKEFYFLAVSYFKKNQECKFVFVDKLNKKIISDGDFNFEKCSFIKPPEVLDINLDGYMDFKVWIRVPHQSSSRVFVNHDLHFIYNTKNSLFCESNIGIPCISENSLKID